MYHSKLCKNETVCICNSAGGGSLREDGGNSLKYLKGLWNRNDGGGGNKNFKREELG